MIHADGHHLNDCEAFAAPIGHVVLYVFTASFNEQPGSITKPEERLSIVEQVMPGDRKRKFLCLLSRCDNRNQAEHRQYGRQPEGFALLIVSARFPCHSILLRAKPYVLATTGLDTRWIFLPNPHYTRRKHCLKVAVALSIECLFKRMQV